MPAAYAPLAPGFHPFWFWNDHLEPDEIRRQIAAMHAQGIRGFYIHSRQGLGLPYLGTRFLELVALAVAEAEARGLTAHLYDEYPYPSGIAGGRVTLGRPENQATQLSLVQHDLPGGEVRLEFVPGAILACQAFPLRAGRVDWDKGIDLAPAIGPVLSRHSYNETGLTAYNRKRYFASQPVPTLLATLPTGTWRLQTALQTLVTAHKYWGAFADVMRPEVVASFIAETHERYRDRLGSDFGTAVGSIFVDETAPGWTPALPAWYRERWGRELDYAALAAVDHPRHLETRYELQEVQYERFCVSFEEPIRNWCRAHGLRYAGEKPTGRLAQLRFMDLPGCEPGHVKTGAPLDLLGPSIRQNAKAVASAAFFYEKEGALCECFHSLGWSGNLQDAKRLAEGLLITGVEFLVPHGFFYSTHGLRKHDAPPSFFHQQPFWPFFGQLSARLDQVRAAWSGRPEAQVLLLDPSDGLPTTAQTEAYVLLQQELMAHQIEFLMADREILERGQVEKGRLRLNDLTIQALVVPPVMRRPDGVAETLARLEAAGLKIWHLATDAVGETVAALAESLDRPLCLNANAGDARAVWLAARVKDGSRRWFLLNTSSQPVELEFSGPAGLREIPLAGQSARLGRQPNGWRRRLEGNESFLLAETAGGGEADPVPAGPDLRLEIPERLSVSPRQPNLLRLGEWDLRLIDAAGRESPAARVAPMPLANQLAASQLAFAPQVRFGFGVMPTLELPRLRLRYETSLQLRTASPISLIMEPQSLSGEWQLWCNDVRLETDALASIALPVQGCLALDLTKCLHPGENRLRLELETERLDGGLLNPFYLAGDFGVTAGPTLGPRPGAGRFEAYEENQLPYYSGTVEYRFSAPHLAAFRPVGEEVELELALPAGFTDALELALGEGAFHPLPWAPYRLRLSTAELAPDVRLRVHGTIIRAFDGLYFDPQNHRAQDVKLPLSAVTPAGECGCDLRPE